MKAYGSDRSRVVGGRIIILSRLPKGWTPRTPRQGTHAEYPGTAVFWDEEYYEVVSAEGVESGGVRYVLEAWREDHVIRTFEAYNDETEAARLADHERAARQRRHSVVTRFAGVLLGHLPSPVQNHLANELGVSASRMTLVSCFPPLILLGIFIFIDVDARMKELPSPIPVWAWLVALFLFGESVVRYFVAMSQSRPMGSLLGTVLYSIFYGLAGGRRRNLPSPLSEPGDGVFFMLPPPDDVAVQDALAMRAPFLTLLSSAEQEHLAAAYGFDYRKHAYGPAWTILVVASIGVASSFPKVQEGGSVSALVSLLFALALAVEQIVRLMRLQRRPTGSILAVLVRPLARQLLARR